MGFSFFKQFSFLALSAAFLFFISSCSKGDFDSPPFNSEDPEISADSIISLREVLAQRIPGQFSKLNIDKYIKVVVVADDQTGNLYKTLIIQDEVEKFGIQLLIDDVELYNFYPEGRRLFVRLRDLWIGDFNGLPQLGFGTFQSGNNLRMAGIPAGVDRAIIKAGSFGNKLTPEVLTINQLTSDKLNTLIALEDVQFDAASAGKTYANNVVNPPVSVNLTLVDCNGRNILVRTSGFSNFAGTLTPTMNGRLVAIYSIFGQDRQLTIRTPNEVEFNNPRCGAANSSIKAIRDAFAGGATTAPASVITATVISSGASLNFNNRNLYIQDETGGIAVRFAAAHNFELGDILSLNVTGAELSQFNGLLQLNNVGLGNATRTGNGPLPAPAVVTTAQLLANPGAYESRRIQIRDANLSPAGTFAGNKTITDASGSVPMFTLNGATFANATMPTGNVAVTGIFSIFNTPQVLLNAASDVTGGSGGGGGGGGGGDLMTIAALRALANAGTTAAPNNKIEGVVISSNTSGNVNARNLYIQDATGGIVVRFSANHTFEIGSKIQVDVAGLELSRFNGLLQLNNVPNAKASKLGNEALPAATEITLAALKADFEKYESTRVVIKGATITGGATFAGSRTVTDATGTITMFTNNNANFASSTIPTGTVEVTAIASRFTDFQLIINAASDVKP